MPGPGNEASGELLTHPANQPSILVVEDSQEMSSFIAGILRNEYHVVTAFDGQEGIERALALQPDLIVTDIMMPRMSGDQLVAEVRSRHELDPIPILLLTAKADDDLRVKLLQTGAQDYLTKPFHSQELLARAGNLIAMKRTGDTLRTELASASGDIEGLAKQIAIKRRQLQTALDVAEIAKEQAEQATQVKAHFLGLVSHELRTPLSTIQMNSELLATQQEIQLPESQRLRVGRLTRATRQMATLIEGLLEYTRIESGKIVAHWENVDTIAVAQEVLEAQKENTPPGVQLDFIAPDKLPPLVCDGKFLRIILDNLVSNALKFTGHGTVTLQLCHEENSHIFEVHDTGIGIPEADMARIFQPFEQLEPVHRKSIPGVGLGLALVKQIVEALGGKVEVTSRAGAGSTFRVWLSSQPQH
jgi:signal transduction histidine kinase